MSEAIHLTDAEFNEKITGTDLPVLVDFWAAWCGPCRMIAPIVEELASEYHNKAIIAKLDVDNNQQTAMQFGIRSIPTILIFKNGQVVDTIIGAVPKEQIISKLEAQIN